MSDQLQPGDRAPAFRLPVSEDREVALSDYKGKTLALYFYPRDDTPGCTKQAVSFSAHKDAFAAANAAVLGVSADTLAKHAKFQTKHDLTIDLGADPDGDVLQAYGVWVEKKMYGKTFMGIERSTFLIDGDGVVQAVWRKVKVPGHVEAVLERAREFAS